MGNWEKWGEQNDGTYRNPIIPADYSDIDCIQVGDDYYATFFYFPIFSRYDPATLQRPRKLGVLWEYYQ